jgi:hypothetical protein
MWFSIPEGIESQLRSTVGRANVLRRDRVANAKEQEPFVRQIVELIEANDYVRDVPRFRKDRWPIHGPVRDLLSYLDDLHAEAGRPSLAEMGRAVALAPSTLSAFFTGARLIGKGNLELLVEHLDGDPAHAERLRRRAVQAAEPPSYAEPVFPACDAPAAARLEIVIYDAPVNKLNRPDSLVGRDGLIRTLHGLLDDGRQVVLYGLGGVGKTALAATVADQRVEAGLGKYVWLRSGDDDPDLLLDGLIRGLAPAGQREAMSATTGDARLLTIQQLFAGLGVSLCVIDDAWHAEVLRVLLRALPPGLPALVTSRRKFVAAEQIEVAQLAEPDAVCLLALHARDDSAASGPAAALLCQELGYHAYAIEIAGQHLRQYGSSPGELREQIAGAPHDLAMPAGFAAPGRESVKRLLDNSFAALPGERERAVLRSFGVFFGAGATAELLAGYHVMPLKEMQVILHTLVDLSLVKRVPGKRLYVVHDLTYSYARTSHAEWSQSAVLAAVRDFVREHASRHDLLDDELSNVLGAASAARQQDQAVFIGIIETLTTRGYLDVKGYPAGFPGLLDEAIGCLGDAPETAARRHLLLSKRGNAQYHQGWLESAIVSYRLALGLAPDPGRQVVLLSVLGKTYSALGKHAEAEEYFAKAYAIADDSSMLAVLEQHNVAAFGRRDYAQVRELTLRGVELARRLGMRRFEGFFLNNLGTAEFELGVCAAVNWHEQAQAIAREDGDDQLLALTHHALGIDRHAQETRASARQHLEEALRLYEKLGQTERHEQLRAMMRGFGYLN